MFTQCPYFFPYIKYYLCLSFQIFYWQEIFHVSHLFFRYVHSPTWETLFNYNFRTQYSLPLTNILIPILLLYNPLNPSSFRNPMQLTYAVDPVVLDILCSRRIAMQHFHAAGSRVRQWFYDHWVCWIGLLYRIRWFAA